MNNLLLQEEDENEFGKFIRNHTMDLKIKSDLLNRKSQLAKPIIV